MLLVLVGELHVWDVGAEDADPVVELSWRFGICISPTSLPRRS